MTTTTIGTWHSGQTLGGPSGYVIDALGSYADDFDIDGLTDAFVARITEHLPAGVWLAGDQIIAAVDYAGDPRQDIRDAVESIDFYALAADYDRKMTTETKEGER